jgi:hypothetical protein
VIELALISIKGPEKTTRGEVNESQSKFLEGTWPISQNRPDAHLFQLGQDCLAIDELSALETGLETAAETRVDADKTTCEINDKNQTKEHFISSQTFHRIPDGRIQEISAEERFEPKTLESFNLVT